MTVLDGLHAHLLWVAIAWPLVLALPWRRGSRSWVHALAIAPGVLLAVWPGDASCSLPSGFLVRSLAISGPTRWVLAVTVVAWLVSANLGETRRDRTGVGSATLFRATLAGNLGVILSTDLVGFLVFSTLMGYGFYGLFVRGADERTRTAARIYLVFLILGDQALFEAMLTAARATPDLTFNAVRQAMASDSHASTFISFAVIGFSLKAGLWPTHAWLSRGFRDAPLPVASLLGAVPVTMALLGAVRWLPLGNSSGYVHGSLVQLAGMAAVAYGALRLFNSSRDCRVLPASVVAILTGAFIAFLGSVLLEPNLWRGYERWVPPFLAVLGLLPVVLTHAVRWWAARHPHAISSAPPGVWQRWGERWLAAARRWSARLMAFRSHMQTLLLRALESCQPVLRRWAARFSLSEWSTALTLFVLLGLALAWLAM